MEKKCEKGYKLNGGRCTKTESSKFKTIYGIRYWLVGLFLGAIVGGISGFIMRDKYLSNLILLIILSIILFGGIGAGIGFLINKFTKK